MANPAITPRIGANQRGDRMAWKMIYLARRNPALAPEQFSQAWREHSALGAGCTNVRAKVVQVMQCSRVLQGPVPTGCSTAYDGVNLLEIRDRQAADDIWSDAETLAIMRPDEPRVFSTYVRHFTLVCEGQALVDVPRGACVVVGFLRRAAGADDAAWARAAQAVSGSLQGDGQDPGRRVWNRVAAEPPPGYHYDAIVEWWFATPDAARAALGAQGVPAGLPAALLSTLDAAASVFMFTQVTHHRP